MMELLSNGFGRAVDLSNIMNSLFSMKGNYELPFLAL